MRVVNVEQGSDAWQKLRLGKVTGTRLKDLMGTPLKFQDTVNDVLAEWMTERFDEIVPNEAMIRGIEEEPLARKEYEKRTGKKLIEVGFVLSDRWDWVGYSPDGLELQDGVYTSLVEFKNPKSKTFIKYIRDGLCKRGSDYMIGTEVPKEYFWQIIQGFIVCDTVQEADFVVYDSRILDSPLQMQIVNVKREDVQDAIEKATAKLEEFEVIIRSEYEKLAF